MQQRLYDEEIIKLTELHKKMKIFFLLIIILLFTSCLQQTINIDENLKGSIAYVISEDSFFKEFSKIFNQENTSIDFNTQYIIDNEALLKVIEQKEGLKIINHSKELLSDKTIYKTEIAFENYNELENLLPNKYFYNRIYKEKKQVFIETTLGLEFLGQSKAVKEKYNSLDEKGKASIDFFASQIIFTFIYNSTKAITNPKNIKSAVLSNNDQTFTVKYSLQNLLQSTTDPKIEIIIKY
jgi:hypothetical protein